MFIVHLLGGVNLLYMESVLVMKLCFPHSQAVWIEKLQDKSANPILFLCIGT